VIFDIVACIVMKWTMPNMQDMQEGAHPKKKKKSVAG
jgi:hypothetical protein